MLLSQLSNYRPLKNSGANINHSLMSIKAMLVFPLRTSGNFTFNKPSTLNPY